MTSELGRRISGKVQRNLKLAQVGTGYAYGEVYMTIKWNPVEIILQHTEAT
jgi:hypothetical protein